MTTNASNLGKTLVSEMGSGVTIPTVDLGNQTFEHPNTVDNPLYVDVDSIDVDKLTSGSAKGSGVFDKVMASLKAHLKEEYDDGRINSDQYSKAYVELTTSGLSAAIQMVLQSGQSTWQTHQAQLLAQRAEIENSSAAVALETAKTQLVQSTIAAHVAEAQYASEAMRPALLNVEHDIQAENLVHLRFRTANMLALEQSTAEYSRDAAQAQVLDIQAGIALKESQNAISAYQLASMMPQELANLVAQEALTNAQKFSVDGDTSLKAQQVIESQYRIDNMLPQELLNAQAQVALSEAQVDKIEAEVLISGQELAEKIYRVTNMLPVELSTMENQRDLVSAQELGVQAETSLTGEREAELVYRVANILPAELAQMTAETGLSTGRTALVSQETALKAEEVAAAAYRTLNMFPIEKAKAEAERDLITSQAAVSVEEEALRAAQTSEIAYRVANLLPVELINLGKQTEILDAQHFEVESRTQVNTEEASLKQYQLANQYPAEAAGMLLENDLRTIRKNDLLPAQVTLVEEQTKSQRGQHSDYVDAGGTITLAGVMGKQRDLYAQQIQSYVSDAKFKVGKLYSDAYMTQLTMEALGTVPSQFQSGAIDDVMAALRSNVSLS